MLRPESVAEEEAVRGEGEGEGAEGEKLVPREADTERRSSSLTAAMRRWVWDQKVNWWVSSRLTGVLETPSQKVIWQL